MNWRTIALVLYLVGTLNMIVAMYLKLGEFSIETVFVALQWPVYLVYAMFWNTAL